MCAANCELREYIRQMRARGASMEAIRARLMEAGWRPEQIDRRTGAEAEGQEAPDSDSAGTEGARSGEQRRKYSRNMTAAMVVATVGLLASMLIAGCAGPVLMVVFTSIWIGVDAARVQGDGAPVGGRSAIAWALASLVLWIPFLPMYYVARARHTSHCSRSRSCKGADNDG